MSRRENVRVYCVNQKIQYLSRNIRIPTIFLFLLLSLSHSISMSLLPSFLPLLPSFPLTLTFSSINPLTNLIPRSLEYLDPVERSCSASASNFI